MKSKGVVVVDELPTNAIDRKDYGDFDAVMLEPCWGGQDYTGAEEGTKELVLFKGLFDDEQENPESDFEDQSAGRLKDKGFVTLPRMVIDIMCNASVKVVVCLVPFNYRGTEFASLMSEMGYIVSTWNPSLKGEGYTVPNLNTGDIGGGRNLRERSIYEKTDGAGGHYEKYSGPDVYLFVTRAMEQVVASMKWNNWLWEPGKEYRFDLLRLPPSSSSPPITGGRTEGEEERFGGSTSGMMSTKMSGCCCCWTGAWGKGDNSNSPAFKNWSKPEPPGDNVKKRLGGADSYGKAGREAAANASRNVEKHRREAAENREYDLYRMRQESDEHGDETMDRGEWDKERDREREEQSDYNRRGDYYDDAGRHEWVPDGDNADLAIHEENPWSDKHHSWVWKDSYGNKVCINP